MLFLLCRHESWWMSGYMMCRMFIVIGYAMVVIPLYHFILWLQMLKD